MPYNTILEILSESTARFYKGRHENFCNTFKSQYFLFSFMPICFSEILIFPTLKKSCEMQYSRAIHACFFSKVLGSEEVLKSFFWGDRGTVGQWGFHGSLKWQAVHWTRTERTIKGVVCGDGHGGTRTTNQSALYIHRNNWVVLRDTHPTQLFSPIFSLLPSLTPHKL